MRFRLHALIPRLELHCLGNVIKALRAELFDF